MRKTIRGEAEVSLVHIRHQRSKCAGERRDLQFYGSIRYLLDTGPKSLPSLVLWKERIPNLTNGIWVRFAVQKGSYSGLVPEPFEPV